MSSFKLWLKYAKPTQGTLTVDDGAERALRERGTSLLPVGIVEIVGQLRRRRRGRGARGRGQLAPDRQGDRELLGRGAGADTGHEVGCGARGVSAGGRGGRAPRLLRLGVKLHSQYDREIVGLAVPALGALAAEPLYLLADTAMVGHLGTPELAALAIAGTLLTGSFTLFNFLTYGTTAQVSRLIGAGEPARAGSIAAQALWLSTGIGVVMAVLIAALAGAARRAGRGHRRARRSWPWTTCASPPRGCPFAHDRAGRAGLPARRVGPAHAARDPRRGQPLQHRPRAWC